MANKHSHEHEHDHQHDDHHHDHGAGCDHPPLEPIRRATPKVGRNEPCPCGSGKKFKKCHEGQATA